MYLQSRRRAAPVAGPANALDVLVIRVVVLVAVFGIVHSSSAAPRLATYPQDASRLSSSRLLQMREEVLSRIYPDAWSQGPLAHALVGVGPTPALLFRLSLALRVSETAEGLHLSSDILSNEHHPGETVAALARILGPEHIIESPVGSLPVGSLVAKERRSERLSAAYEYITAGSLRSDVDRLVQFTESLADDIEAMTTADFRVIGTLQRKINSAELSWLIEAIGLEWASRGESFGASWPTARGTLSLADLVDANIALLREDQRIADVPLLTERGLHLLLSLTRTHQIFKGDPSFEGKRQTYENVIDELVELIIVNPTTRPHRLRQTDFVRAAHVLEFLHDDAYYKPALLVASGECAALEQASWELLESRVRSRDVLGFSFGMHVLNAIDLMLRNGH